MAEENPIEWAVPDPESSTVGKILIGYDHDTYEQALAADIVTALPIGGDALLLVRANRAKEAGELYPDEQAYAQNILSDFPTPLGAILESLSMPNTVNYLDENPGVDIAPGVELQKTHLDQAGVDIVYPNVTALPDKIEDPIENLTT